MIENEVFFTIQCDNAFVKVLEMGPTRAYFWPAVNKMRFFWGKKMKNLEFLG